MEEVRICAPVAGGGLSDEFASSIAAFKWNCAAEERVISLKGLLILDFMGAILDMLHHRVLVTNSCCRDI